MKIILLPTIDFQLQILLSRFTLSLRDLEIPLWRLSGTPRFDHASRGTRWLWQDGHWVYHRGPLETRWKHARETKITTKRNPRNNNRPRWISWKKIDETPGMLKVFAFVLLFFCWLCVLFFLSTLLQFLVVPLGFGLPLTVRSCCKSCNPWMKNCWSDSPWSNVARCGIWFEERVPYGRVPASCTFLYIVCIPLYTYILCIYIYLCIPK